MRIKIDDVISDQGTKVGEMVIHTEDVTWNKMPSPTAAGQMMTAPQWITWLLANPAKHKDMGWEELCHCAEHPPMPRVQHLLAQLPALQAEGIALPPAPAPAAGQTVVQSIVSWWKTLWT